MNFSFPFEFFQFIGWQTIMAMAEIMVSMAVIDKEEVVEVFVNQKHTKNQTKKNPSLSERFFHLVFFLSCRNV